MTKRQNRRAGRGAQAPVSPPPIACRVCWRQGFCSHPHSQPRPPTPHPGRVGPPGAGAQLPRETKTAAQDITAALGQPCEARSSEAVLGVASPEQPWDLVPPRGPLEVTVMQQQCHVFSSRGPQTNTLTCTHASASRFQTRLRVRSTRSGFATFAFFLKSGDETT